MQDSPCSDEIVRSQFVDTEKVTSKLSSKSKDILSSPEEEIDVIPASFEPSTVRPVEKMERKKKAKGTKNDKLETSQHELEKMRQVIHNTQNSQVQDEEDPYFFSDDEEQQERHEITVGKFYAKNGQESGANKKQKGYTKTKKQGEEREKQNVSHLNNTTIEKPKSLPAVSKPSVDTIRKRDERKASTPGYEEELPDLIVENDSFSQYREYEYRFFKSRNSADTSTVGKNKTPRQTAMNVSSKDTKFFKARARSKENATNAGMNEKGSLMFTSSVAGAPKVKNTRGNQKKGQTSTATTGEQKGRRSRSKKKAASAEVESTVAQSSEVHVTRLDSRESPIHSPVQLSNIDITKSPELRSVAIELEKANNKMKKREKESEAIKQDNNDNVSSNTYRQKMMQKIKQKMDEASGDREQLEKMLGKTDKNVSNSTY